MNLIGVLPARFAAPIDQCRRFALGMPVMTGWAFRAEQQRDPKLAHIPVIIISAIISFSRTVTTLNAAGYLDKPVDIHTLLSTVYGIIGRAVA